MLGTIQETASSAMASTIVVYADSQVAVCVTAVASGVQNSVMKAWQGQEQAEADGEADYQAPDRRKSNYLRPVFCKWSFSLSYNTD